MAEGFISDEDIQRVRDANDIVAVIGERVPVKQKGRDFWCCCPLHNEKTPSFKIDPALQLWHCFGCGEGGDVFGFVMKTEDLTFPEAVRRLAERGHVEITQTGGRGASSSKKARLREICAATAEFYHTQLMRSREAGAASARSYLAGRGLGGEVPKRWCLGYAPGHGALLRHLSARKFSAEDMVEANVVSRGNDGRLRDRFYNRVMFPIFDVQGECIAFGGRVIGQGEPKYLNSQETPIFYKSQVLYGLDKAKTAMASTGIAVVVEGYTDVIALHEAGVQNAVATLGTALTMRHIRVLSRHASKRIVYLFDGDAAGQRAADRALQFIDGSMTPEAGKNKIELCAVTLPDNLDPAEFVAVRGADALRELLDNAQPLLKYGIERRLAAHDLGTAEGRTRALADALSVLAPIKDSLLAKDYAVQIAARVRMRESDVLEQLARLAPPRAARDDAPSHDAAAPASAGAPGAQEPLDARPDGQAGARMSNAQRFRSLPAVERNRLLFEREFLSVLAQHPLLALEHADALAGTGWHSKVHEALATSMLQTLVEDPAASAATVIANAEAARRGAASVLTSAVPREGSTPEQVCAYLAEELSLGDAEEAVATMKARLADAQGTSPEEAGILFNTLVETQKDITARRAAHRPLA
ncbi:MAG: DNA primase [Eggerthellaceae bacterium]|nr:DNA primase [Eggerthellaceae bacterium]